MQAGKFIGMYSTAESMPGGDSGFEVQRVYWHVWYNDHMTVLVRRLDAEAAYAGPAQIIMRAELEMRFSREPDPAKRPDDIRSVPSSSSVARDAGMLKDSGQAPNRTPVFSASAGKPDHGAKDKEALAKRMQRCQAAEEKVRRLFIRDLDAFLKNIAEPNPDAFREPLTLNVDWLPEYKHMFSNLGIKLRQLKLYKRAIEYYVKAQELAPQDDHIYFNLACAHYALGDAEAVRYWLKRALEVDPRMELAQKFLDYLDMRHPAPARPETTVRTRQ